MPDFPTPPDLDVVDTPHGRVVTLACAGGRAVVHEHGAHVTSWVPSADGLGEALFTSRHARIDGRSAIRGGVPVIFPQFGPGPLPKHGFARTARWSLEGAGVDEAGAAFARLVLVDDAATRATWPHAFRARLTVRVDDGLAIALAVENTGDAPFRFTGALHTYLRVGDVAHATVHGLAGTRLRDQLRHVEATESEPAVRVVGAMDRVYVDVPGPLRVADPMRGRTLHVSATGLPDVVLWNPWAEGARALDDMDEEEWREMLCVEAAVVAEPVSLAPGARWEGAQRLVVAR